MRIHDYLIRSISCLGKTESYIMYIKIENLFRSHLYMIVTVITVSSVMTEIIVTSFSPQGLAVIVFTNQTRKLMEQTEIPTCSFM